MSPCRLPGIFSSSLLCLAIALTVCTCGGPGDEFDVPLPDVRPPDEVQWQSQAVAPSELLPHIQYWRDLKWPAGVFPVNIFGEPLLRRRALMYYSCEVGPFVRPSTLVVQTVQSAQGEKNAAMSRLCKEIGFTISDQTYSPFREAETYFIWIRDFSYGQASLAWLSDYILVNYSSDFVAVQPMISNRPFWSHNEGAGWAF